MGLLHCLKCGYDLTGNDSRRCPECGGEFDPLRAPDFYVKPIGTGELVGLMTPLAAACGFIGLLGPGAAVAALFLVVFSVMHCNMLAMRVLANHVLTKDRPILPEVLDGKRLALLRFGVFALQSALCAVGFAIGCVLNWLFLPPLL